MEEIKKWLQGDRDYDQGLQLLLKYSKKRALVMNLNRKNHPRKLLYELKKLSGGKDIPQKPKKQKEQTPESPPEAPKVNTERDNLSDDLQELYDKTVVMYKKARGIHSKLQNMHESSDAEREPYTKELKLLDLQIRHNWEIIDGKEEADEGEQKAPVINNKRISSNRKYISTNRSRLQKGQIKPGKIQDVKAEIKKRVEELRSVNESVNQSIINELKALDIDV